MQKYSVIHQKNVYYIDLENHTYKGYIETLIECSNIPDYIEYKVQGLNIEEVLFLSEKNEFKLSTEIEHFEAEKYVDNFDSDFIKDYINSHVLKVLLNTEETKFKIKIKFSLDKTNDAINFYENSWHKECLAENLNFNSSLIFPNIIYGLGISLDLYYIIKGNYTVISPGVFKGLIEQKDYSIYSYYVENGILESINFGVGSFDSIEVVTGDDTKSVYFPMTQDDNHSHFKENIKEIIYDVYNCIKFLENFTFLEFPNVSIVFSHLESFSIGKNTAFISLFFLPFSNSIEQNFLFKEKICYVLSCQIFITFLGSEYIKQGLIGYLTDNCLKYFLGNNEVIFKLKKEKDYIVSNDVNELALNNVKRSKISKLSTFFRIKSKLFIFLLENNLSKAFMQKIIYAVLEKKVVFSEEFIKIIKNVTGKEMGNLFDIYVNKPGLVIFVCTFEIEQKKNKITLQIKQKYTSSLPDANRKLQGNLCIKAHEMEGAFEYFYNLQKSELIFNYHTRTKKNKKKESEAISLLWLRIDPKGEFLAGIELHQPDFMYIEALINDKNVTSQLEAIRALEKRPSEQICAAFERVINDQHFFYKIRIEAINALSQMSLTSYEGYQKVIQFFIKKFCLQGSTIVKPNDFNNFSQYFIQKHLLKSIAYCHPSDIKLFNDREVTIRDICISFINNSLIYNDNETNIYDDSYYISSIIDSLSLPLCSQEYPFSHPSNDYELNFEEKLFDDFSSSFTGKLNNKQNEIGDITLSDSSNDYNKNSRESKKSNDSSSNKLNISDKHTDSLKKSLELIERFRKLDLLFPSPNNIITATCLHSLGRLSIYGFVKLNKDMIKNYSLKGNSISVRLIALEILIMLKEDIDYIFKLLIEDHYVIKKNILSSIKGLISNVITNEYMNYFREHKSFFYRLIPYCTDILLFETLAEIILFLENKGKEIKKIEEIKLHEFSDELFPKEVEDESELITFKYVEPPEKKRKIEEIPLIKISTQPFVDLFTQELIAKSEKVKKIKIKIKKINEFDSKDFLIKIQRHIPKIREDSFLLSYRNLLIIDLLNEFINLEGISRVNEVILLNRNKEGFFEYNPLTFDEIVLLNDYNCLLIDNYDLFIDLCINIHLTILYAITYEKYNSKTYIQMKNQFSYLEKMIYDFLPLQEIKMIDQNKFINFIDKLINLQECYVFIEPVDYKLFKLVKYVDIVRYPLCISLVKNKLINNLYFNELVLLNELRRIFINCLMFNHSESEIYINGKTCLSIVNEYYQLSEDDNLENIIDKNNTSFFNILRKQYENTRISKNYFNELLLKIMIEVIKLNESRHFVNKIEDINYKTKIGRQMYLHKLMSKCELKMYVTLGHFIYDFKLIKENCITFNGMNSFYLKDYKVLEKHVKKQFSYYFGEDCVRVYFNKL